MPNYQAPLRDMHFVLHELLDVENELRSLPAHAEMDADTINQVLEEGGKFWRPRRLSLRRGYAFRHRTSRIQAGVSTVRSGGLACAIVRSGLWRAGLTDCFEQRFLRNAQFSESGMDHVSRLVAWCV